MTTKKLTRARKRQLRSEARRFASSLLSNLDQPDHWDVLPEEEQLFLNQEMHEIADRLNKSRPGLETGVELYV